MWILSRQNTMTDEKLAELQAKAMEIVPSYDIKAKSTLTKQEDCEYDFSATGSQSEGSLFLY